MKAEIAKHPNPVKTVAAKLEEDLNLTVRPKTLKQFYIFVKICHKINIGSVLNFESRFF
jgi:hypothetical protein